MWARRSLSSSPGAMEATGAESRGWPSREANFSRILCWRWEEETGEPAAGPRGAGLGQGQDKGDGERSNLPTITIYSPCSCGNGAERTEGKGGRQLCAGFRLLAAELGGQEGDHTGKEARKRVQEKEDRRKRRVFPLTPRLRGCPARHQQPVSTGVWGQESSPSCTSTLRGQQSRGKHTERPGVSAENQIIKRNEMKFHNRKQELKREMLSGPVSGRETQQDEAISLQTNFKNLHSLKTEILKKNDENLMTS